MSVLIKGMEMPTSCAGCFNRGCGLWQEVALPAHQRHKFCPLVPVPPHGRLIDANAIPYNKIMLEDDDYYYGVTKPYIDRMPTIIPADQAEEGEA